MNVEPAIVLEVAALVFRCTASAREGPRAFKRPGANSQTKTEFTNMENLSLRYQAEEQIDCIFLWPKIQQGAYRSLLDQRPAIV